MTINTNRREQCFFGGVIASCFLLIALLSLQRSYFGFGTETDYLGGFLPEAQRFIERKPLQLEFHPPLYSILIATLQKTIQDWLKTGLIVSLFSSFVVLTTTFFFFKRLINVYAGWGAIIALITSTTFLRYSAYATSDIFSLALYSSCLLLSLLASQANSQKRSALWVLCGVAVGCLLLTRTNGITFLFIAVLPFISSDRQQHKFWKHKVTGFLYFIIGLCFPLLAWFTYASVSGSSVSPAGTYANFALTYFSPTPDRVSGDARIQVEAQFDSLASVLTHDPVHIVKVYLKDLIRLTKKIALMLRMPLSLLIPLGIFAFFKNNIKNRKICLFYAILTLLQVLLINFKAYESRYYLFLIPVLGVAVGEAARYLRSFFQTRRSQRLITAICLAYVTLATTLSYSQSWQAVTSDIGELEEAVPQVVQAVQKLNLSSASLVSRKPHLPFYTGATPLSFPDVKTLPDLKCALVSQANAEATFLYYGTKERDFRRQFEMLLDPEQSPDWLEPVEQSNKVGENKNTWVLYRYRLDNALLASSKCQP